MPTASARTVLERLPSSLDWAVLFRLPRLLVSLGEERALRQAFGLSEGIALPGVDHIVLTSSGPLLARGGSLEPYGPWRAVDDDDSLAERFGDLLAPVDVERADCVGLGQLESQPPVVMAVELDEGGEGAAQAWFGTPPSRDGWELLAAVGVRPLGPAVPISAAGPWRVDFAFALGAHLEAAWLGRFARTASCNRFFLLQGRMDGEVADGLVTAARDRLRAAAAAAYEDALGRAEAVLAGGGRAMTAVTGRTRSRYGDIVPFGLLLAGLRRIPEGGAVFLDRAPAAVAGLEELLRGAERDGGWPFHGGTITTGLDSALVLLGLRDRSALAALERFRSPGDGYAADRIGVPGPSTVAEHPSTAHWHEPDLATTALVQALRRNAGLPASTPALWFAERLDERGSVFVALPWLLDWILALALAGDDDPEAGRLRSLLADEVLASRNPDGTFGHPGERLLATASAALALEELGLHGRPLVLAQLALAAEAPTWRAAGSPAAVPFFSTVRLDVDAAGRDEGARQLLRGQDVLICEGQLHRLTTYEDTEGAVTAGLVARALSRPGDPSPPGPPLPAREPHPRYRCASLDEYVARFALPPAVGSA
jgi:hypothetical protein